MNNEANMWGEECNSGIAHPDEGKYAHTDTVISSFPSKSSGSETRRCVIWNGQKKKKIKRRRESRLGGCVWGGGLFLRVWPFPSPSEELRHRQQRASSFCWEPQTTSHMRITSRTHIRDSERKRARRRAPQRLSRQPALLTEVTLQTTTHKLQFSASGG